MVSFWVNLSLHYFYASFALFLTHSPSILLSIYLVLIISLPITCFLLFHSLSMSISFSATFTHSPFSSNLSPSLSIFLFLCLSFTLFFLFPLYNLCSSLSMYPSFSATFSHSHSPFTLNLFPSLSILSVSLSSLPLFFLRYFLFILIFFSYSTSISLFICNFILLSHLSYSSSISPSFSHPSSTCDLSPSSVYYSLCLYVVSSHSFACAYDDFLARNGWILNFSNNIFVF